MGKIKKPVQRTPGEWIAKKTRRGCLSPYCVVIGANTSYFKKEGDALLCATAPDLLELLHRFTKKNWMEDCICKGIAPRCLQCLAKAAIIKAGGI